MRRSTPRAPLSFSRVSPTPRTQGDSRADPMLTLDNAYSQGAPRRNSRMRKLALLGGFLVALASLAVACKGVPKLARVPKTPDIIIKAD